MSKVLQQNVKTIMDLRRRHEQSKTKTQKLVARVTNFAGGLRFVVVHAILFGSWIIWNSGLLPVPIFDPAPFVGLALWATVECLFLSSFILMRQNEMSQVNERRAELDLQVSLLTESELTELVRIAEVMSQKLGVDSSQFQNLEEAKKEVTPEHVIHELEQEESSL